MRNFVIAGAAWGYHYTDMLLKYCLPSMVVSIEALTRDRKVIISLHTDHPHKIQSSPIMHDLRNMGVEDHYFPLDADDGMEKYRRLGKYQALGLDFARSIHADYHSLMPDHLYSKEHFYGLMAAVERGHRAIARLCLSTFLDPWDEDLKPYMVEGMIFISCADLTALALKNLHPRAQVWAVGADATFPGSHVTFFEGEHTLNMFSPHQSVLYIDRDEIQPVTSGRPLDNELESITSVDCPIYCSKAEDKIGLIEITRADSIIGKEVRGLVHNFCHKYWEVIEKKHPKFLDMECVDPINRDLLKNPFLSESFASYGRKLLINTLYATAQNVNVI